MRGHSLTCPFRLCKYMQVRTVWKSDKLASLLLSVNSSRSRAYRPVKR